MEDALETGSFHGQSMGDPVLVEWTLFEDGSWETFERGDGFREHTMGKGGADSLNKYLETLRRK